MAKKIETLLKDVQDLIETPGKHKVNQYNLSCFNQQINEAIIKSFDEHAERKRTLRLSSAGMADRRIWYEINHKDDHKEFLTYDRRLSFLFGHILEALLIFLIREAGHEVSSQQQEVEVEGIKGHLDCLIDGDLVDIKSASAYAFQKYATGMIKVDDVYGNIFQLASYAHAKGLNRAFLFVMNKVYGTLTLLELEDLDLVNPESRLKHLKEITVLPSPPVELCYEPIPYGTSGNMRLHKNCEFCPFKGECWKGANGGKGIRWFKYSNERVPLVKVTKEPKVQEESL